jgi:hypothetical protein
MSSTIAPVEIKLPETVLISLVRVCPVVTRLPLMSSIIAPVATRLPLNPSKSPEAFHKGPSSSLVKTYPLLPVELAWS